MSAKFENQTEIIRIIPLKLCNDEISGYVHAGEMVLVNSATDTQYNETRKKYWIVKGLRNVLGNRYNYNVIIYLFVIL